MLIYLFEIYTLLGKSKKYLPVLVGLFFLISFLDLLSVGLIGPYLALILNPDSTNSFLNELLVFFGIEPISKNLIMVLGFMLIAVFAIKSIGSILINRAIIRFSEAQQFELRLNLMNAYQSLPYEKFILKNSTDYIYSIQQLTGQFSGMVQIVLKSICDAIVAFSIIGLLAWYNPIALILLVILIGFSVYVFDVFFRNKLKSYGEKTNQGSRIMLQGVREGIDGLKEIRVYGAEKYFYDMVRIGAAQFADFYLKLQVISTAPRLLIEFLLVTFVVSLVFVTLFLESSANLVVTTLGVFGVAALRLLPASTSLSTGLVQLRYNRDAISRLYNDFISLDVVSGGPPQIIKLFHASDYGQQFLKCDATFKRITLDSVSYSYPNAKHSTIKNVSMSIDAGQSIGLIGESGSGKTTIMDILLGLLIPQGGKVIYNEKYSLEDSIASWWKQVAYLPQQTFLMDDSLRKNIAFGLGDSDIDDERLTEAITKARLQELVLDLPQGVDTILGERGVRISGGQKQRIAIARAFYHNRTVLVMDEATSALDDRTENYIVEEIENLRGKITLVVIAHRLKTVSKCDRIYRLHRGRIIENGPAGHFLKVE